MTMRSLLLLQVTQAGTGYGFYFVESVLPLPRIPGSLLCPVTALVNHLRINQVPQDMPLFSVRSDSSLSHITYTHFSSFLARVIKAAGLDSTSYSPHSFRRGGATFAFEGKVPSELRYSSERLSMLFQSTVPQDS